MRFPKKSFTVVRHASLSCRAAAAALTGTAVTPTEAQADHFNDGGIYDQVIAAGRAGK